jgi:LPS export ABC transporter protein LptC
MKWTKNVKIATAVAIILLFAGVVIVAMVMVGGDKKSNIIKILPDEADVRIQDFIYTEVGQENIRWEVKAKTAQYQKKLNLALFDHVHIKLTTPEGKVFVMTGDEGKMQTDTKDVELKGNVVITSDTQDKFFTDYLRYSDGQKKIYTDAPVTVESRQMRIQGVGLTIFINKGELLLSSGVKAKIN